MTLINHQQLTALIDQHSAALVLFARQWCNDPDDAVQQALIELTKLDEVPHDQVAWLFTTTKRRAINQTRGESRHRKRNQIAGDLSNAQPIGSDSTGWFVSEIERREEVEKLQTALDRLEPLEREIVVAHIWGELSFSQIGKLVGSSSSSVHRDYQAVLVKLRAAWVEPPPHHEVRISKLKPSDKALDHVNPKAPLPGLNYE